MNAEPARPLRTDNDLAPDDLREMTPEERHALIDWAERMNRREPDPEAPSLEDIFEVINESRGPGSKIVIRPC